MTNHRIGTVSIDFVSDRKADAWQLQQRLRHLLQHTIIPKLEVLFDRLDDSQSLILIDQIQFDLGRFSRSDLDKAFVKRVVEEITTQLKNATREPPNTAGTRQMKVDEVIVRSFTHFLKTGLIPRKFQSVYARIKEEQVLAALSTDQVVIQHLSDLIRTDKIASKRLRDQYPPDFIQSIISMLDLRRGGETKALKPDIPSMPFEIIKRKGSERIRLEKVQKARELPPVAKDELLDKLPRSLDQGLEEKSDKHYVQNAGLVLLHPWLSGDNEAGFSLFEEIGLVKNEQFIDDLARERALHLLQYLIWGKEQQPEHQMVLDKIMCGFPADSSVNRFVRLSRREKEACKKLAKCISGEWQGISEMSLEALRGSFLQRLGQLHSTSLGWKLTVEKNTIDILLKKLPYGLGVIKFPWMEKMLWVEWDY